MTQAGQAIVSAATAQNLLTYQRGPFSASVEARASASASASYELRRGVRASAEAEASAQFETKLAASPDGQHAQALVKAEVSASARAAFAGQLDVHGLFAEVALGAEARARVQADLSLSGAALLQGLQDDLPGYLYRPALALLSHTSVHAGVFAEVYLALKLHARLQAGGSLIPINGAPAGFTVNFRYGYAYIYGAGVHGYVDFEYPDAAAVVDAVVAELVEQLDHLVPDDAPPQVMMLIRLVLPLAGAAAVSVGRSLGAPRTTKEEQPADLSTVLSAFWRELRTHGLGQVLTTVVRSAADDMARQLAASLRLNPRLLTLGEQALDQAKAIVESLAAAGQSPDRSPIEALPPVIQVCGILADLGDGSATDPLRDVADGCTVVGVGISLLLTVLGEPVPPLPRSLIERVRAGLTAAGTAPEDVATDPTMVQLIEYLAATSGAFGSDGLRVLGEIAQTLGRTPEALIRWLWELGSDTPDPAAGRRLAEAVVTAVTSKLEAELTPFVDQLPAGDLKELAIFIRPLLEIVDTALPALFTTATDWTPTKAARLRDQLDTQLTQLFGALTVRVMNRVIRPYFRRGPEQLRELADRVDRSDPAFAEFFALANQFSALFRINEVIVAAALRETAEILALVESSGFESAMKLMESFVLLPEDNAERRVQLARLAGTDQARIGDAELWGQLVEAMFVDSHVLALGMIPPSIRMSTLIAVEQGPLPLVSLFEDAKQIGRAIGETIGDLEQTGSDVAALISGLIEKGKLNAQLLTQISADFKRLLRSVGNVIDSVLRTLKDILWPIFVASTGGWGFLLRDQFDDFFDGAAWIVDRVLEAIGRLADEIIALVIRVAQGLGILDTGSGADLGGLGRAIQQQALSQPGQTAVTVQYGIGTASVSRAQLGVLVSNAVFANGSLRDQIRQLHGLAAEQVTLASRVDNLRSSQGDNAARIVDLQQQAAAKTRPTGTPLNIRIGGIASGQTIVQEAVFSLSVPVEHQNLVADGGTVRLEVGGQPLSIDEQLWHLDGDGNLSCSVALMCEPPATTPDAVPVKIQQLRDAERAVRAGAGRRARSVPSVFRPRDGVVAAAETVMADDFIPWALSADGPTRVTRPMVLARHQELDPPTDVIPLPVHDGPARPVRPADGPRMRSSAPSTARRAVETAAPSPTLPAFTSTTQLRAALAETAAAELTVVEQPAGAFVHPALVFAAIEPVTGAAPRPRDPTVHEIPNIPRQQIFIPGGPLLIDTVATPAPQYAAVAVVPPGYCTITACISAVPGPGQDRDTTPKGVTTTWCVVSAAD